MAEFDPTAVLHDMPLLPLRDVVVYPNMVIPLFVGRPKSIRALEQAMAHDKHIFLLAQRNAADDDPGEDGLYAIGTVATILQLLKLPDGTAKVLVEGNQRATLRRFIQHDTHVSADVTFLQPPPLSDAEADVLGRSLLSRFEHYVKASKKIPPEVLSSVAGIEDFGRLADTIAAHMPLRLDDKQKILEMFDLKQRIEHLLGMLEGEMDVLEAEKRIRTRVKKQMEKSQRDYYLHEQMKAIQKELGEDNVNEVEELAKKIDAAGMPKAARDKAAAELKKLKMMAPMSAEASVVRTYLDWLVQMPWKKRSKVRLDINQAREVLDQDHYGLEDVKERVLEYLAVQSRIKSPRGPILCLVGPPGVGKTSLGKSIATATHRQFVRMALGGVRDEAEIRGHRRTYIGSLPGKIVQRLSKVGVKNPLFLLDEIDKMGVDMRGDPASALLEVLDPEQNHSFNDHYLEVDYDLSEVMFICTSNSMNIPAPLLDRMEIIRIPGYTEDEKVNIATRYLLPKQIEVNGLKPGEVAMSEAAVRDIIRFYTREAGVRNLDREISKVCRKVVKEHAEARHENPVLLEPALLEDYLGVRKFSIGKMEEQDRIGQVTGLAWTQAGGDLLTIEAVAVPGKGKHQSTGSLGDVMQESIKAALTVVRSRAASLGIHPDFYEKFDIHLHVPEGATPKDGPSAGIGMCTAMVSVLTGIPVRADVAMTGEITLRGQTLPIGGLKEKLLAAHRGGIKTVIIPKENERDLREIPDNIKGDLNIIAVSWIDEVLAIALTRTPTPLPAESLLPVVAKNDDPGVDDGRVSQH